MSNRIPTNAYLRALSGTDMTPPSRRCRRDPLAWLRYLVIAVAVAGTVLAIALP
jgi:hypothetical protein